MIAEFFGWAEGYLTSWFQAAHAPEWLHGILILGLFRGIGAVISVMLPPMAIFFLCSHYWKTTDTYHALRLIWTAYSNALVHTANNL